MFRTFRHDFCNTIVERGTFMSTQVEAAAIDQLSINTIRTLSMDAVQAANSGHPGTPMALAPLVYCLWQRLLRFDPENPIWMNRDRFVLSAGHASMLLYSILHLTGVKAVNSDYERLGDLSVKLDDIRHFRQLESKCPGHPEYRWTSGVETTTGPLGQGVANSVGMALAGRWMASIFNRPGFEMFNYRVYAICSDGDMMEGISSEAASGGFGRLLNSLLRNKQIGKYIVPIIPDEARTFGMEAFFSQYGIYASTGQLYKPVDAGTMAYYREAKNGQILEEGINEPGAMSSFIAAGPAYANLGVTMIPFYIYYSMFGFQRVGDFIWCAADSRCKGFLLGGTAGRTTLNGEGLQHEDGHSHLMAATVPNLLAYDPAYA